MCAFKGPKQSVTAYNAFKQILQSERSNFLLKNYDNIQNTTKALFLVTAKNTLLK